jgi:uncharacterized membrane protein (UPF0127 family)
MRQIARKTTFVLVLIALVFGVSGAGRSGSSAVEKLSIETSSATHDFDVELAVTADQQRTGLMYRRRMAPDAGMLFLYDNGSRVTMWMSNTYIPLDMLFIAADGRITHIVERTVPLSTELIGSNGPVRAVLELNGGTASRLGIKVGDTVRHRSFQ